MTADGRKISIKSIIHMYAFFSLIFNSDLIKTIQKWTDQCHYFKIILANTGKNGTKAQDNKLGTYTSKSKIQKSKLIIAVLTYLPTTCFPFRASDRSSNAQHRKCRYFPYNRNCPVISAPLQLWIEPNVFSLFL